MGRSKTRPDPRPSYAQELNYTGVYWKKGRTTNHSPRWQCKLTGRSTLGKGEGRLLLGYFRDNRAEYIKAAKAWDRARIALAYVRKELIHLLSADARKESGCKLNFARQNYKDVIQLLKGVEIPKNTDALRALIKAVALEKPLPQPGSPGTSHEAADSDEEVKVQDLITEKDASDEAEESPLPSVRRAAGQASGRRKRSDTPPEDTPAAKVQKRAPPRTVPTSVAAEVQQQAAMLEELRQAQATEELRRDRREAELKKQNEVLLAKVDGLAAKVDGLAAKSAQQEKLSAQQERLIAHLERFNTHVLEENEELRGLLLAKEG